MALPGYSAALALSAAGDILLAALVAWLLVSLVAWVSTMGGSYLPPLGFTIFMLMLGMIVGTTGWGKWFPWSIVPLFAGVAGPPAETLAPGSLIVLVLTSVVGVVATLYRVRYADNTQ
jgi:ABC-2 type transport system permease protein